MWATIPSSAFWVTVERSSSAVSWAIFHAPDWGTSAGGGPSDAKYMEEKIPESRLIQSGSRKILFPVVAQPFNCRLHFPAS